MKVESPLDPLLAISLDIALVLLALSSVMAYWRLARGPDMANRVAALDLFATLGLGFIAVFSVISGQSVFLDVAGAIAMIAFLATIGFAFYLGQKGGSP